MFSFLRTCFLAATLSSFTDAKIVNCGVDTSLLKLTTLALTPDPPVSGNPLEMTVVFTNPGDAINDGTVTTSVTLNFIPFAPTVEPLCTNTLCPLVSGSNDRSTSTTWPDSIQGKIVSKIVWTTLTGAELLCIQTTVSVGSSNLRGSKEYNTSNAELLVSLFRSNQTQPVYNASYALVVYQNTSQSICYPYENPNEDDPKPSKDLVLWKPKSNALRFSSF